MRAALDAACTSSMDISALNLAILAANGLWLPLLGIFGLTADDPSAEPRHHRFLVEGLVDMAPDLVRRNVRLALNR
jgi:hypothetical protein